MRYQVLCAFHLITRLHVQSFIHVCVSRGAGTDSNVFIEMHGELGSVGQSRLETAANNFERGQVDNFVVKGTNVGDVQKVLIWHDNSGLGSDWHLQQVRRRQWACRCGVRHG